MSVLFWGISVFIAVLAVHLIIWRIGVPRRQGRTLFLILVGVPMVVLPVLAWAQEKGVPVWFAPQGIWDFVHILLLACMLSIAYVASYPALQADSPSLVMVMAIDRAEPEGVDKEYFRKKMNDEILIIPRIQDLLVDQMAVLEGDRYRLTPKGRRIAQFFSFYRYLVNMHKGG